MSTIQQVLDRLYRTYLEPPDYQPALSRLATTLTSSLTDDQVIFSGFAVPEDEQLLLLSGLIELGTEMMRITAYDELTTTATVLRAQEGTTLAGHAQDEKIVIAPKFARSSAFEAIQDNIVLLGSDLYTVNTEMLVAISANVYGINDDLAYSVVDIGTDSFDQTKYDGRIVDYRHEAGGRALITNVGMLGAVWLKYRRRMMAPTLLTENLVDLGVDDQWANIIIVGAAADLMVGRDIPQSQTDWVGQTLQAVNVPIGRRQNVALVLAQYRDYLHRRATKEMNIEYKPRVRRSNPLETRSRGGFG